PTASRFGRFHPHFLIGQRDAPLDRLWRNNWAASTAASLAARQSPTQKAILGSAVVVAKVHFEGEIRRLPRATPSSTTELRLRTDLPSVSEEIHPWLIILDTSRLPQAVCQTPHARTWIRKRWRVVAVVHFIEALGPRFRYVIGASESFMRIRSDVLPNCQAKFPAPCLDRTPLDMGLLIFEM
ncbi:MAG: hypothetical protein OXG44_22350, partial [Gammaproteobacteria bacterium]|nr:hypothetical protein [Gammaproteobacteria bacterium]